jgi:N-acetylglucosaminyldiphosphoundecaprenol N-acetyl-beta-D-mannosaminyltransferase
LLPKFSTVYLMKQFSGDTVQLRINRIETVSLLGVRIHNISLSELLDLIKGMTISERKYIIANVNVHAMNLAYQFDWFRTFLNSSSVVFCDGIGVKWGARLLGLNIKHRYTPPDWISDLCNTCVQNDFSIFFLGSLPGVAEKAAHQLRTRFPNLNVAGTFHGYFDKTKGSLENEAVISKINSVSPDILFVGFGMPLQESWLRENWDRIESNVAITGGALFDYISGTVRRAPPWMTEHGLEWFGRLLVEPKRLWRRYILGNPIFFWRVLLHRFSLS